MAKNFSRGIDSLIVNTEPKKETEKVVRTTFILSVRRLDQLRAMSFWTGDTIKSILDVSLERTIREYEQINGPLKMK